MAAEMLERDRANGDARFDHVEYTLPPVSPGRLPPSCSLSPARHTPLPGATAAWPMRIDRRPTTRAHGGDGQRALRPRCTRRREPCRIIPLPLPAAGAASIGLR